MTAIVEQEWTRVQESADKHDSVTVTSSYRMRVLRHPRGRLVVADSFTLGSIAGIPAGVGAANADAQRALSLIGNLQPSFVVSAEGEFVELSEVERVKAAVDSTMKMIVKDASSMPTEVRLMLDRATSPDVLTAAAAEAWNAVAGTWVGADWELGESYVASVEEPVPMFPGFQMPMDYEFSASERIPCTAGGTGTACVLLEMYSEPDTAQLRKFVAQFLERAAPDARDVASALQHMRVENELTVVTEPRTLRPHLVTRVKRVVVHAAPADGKPAGSNGRVDTRTSRYRYYL